MDSDRLVAFFEKMGWRQGSSIVDGSENVSINCPLAPWRSEHEDGQDRRPSCSIGINPQGRSPVCCWTCGWTGTFLSLAVVYNMRRGGTFSEVVDEIRRVEEECCRLAPIHFGPTPETPVTVLDECVLQEFSGGVPKYMLLPKPEGRGLTIRTCMEWELGIDRVKHRVIFPVRDMSGALVGISSRATSDEDRPKYRNVARFPSSKFWYGEHKIDKALDWWVVVEGQIDVLWLWQCGVRNVVGAFGSSISKPKADKCLKYAGTVYEAFDEDAAGEKARKALYEALGSHVRVVRVRMPDKCDPADLSVEQVKELFAFAIPVEKGSSGC